MISLKGIHQILLGETKLSILKQALQDTDFQGSHLLSKAEKGALNIYADFISRMSPKNSLKIKKSAFGKRTFIAINTKKKFLGKKDSDERTLEEIIFSGEIFDKAEEIFINAANSGIKKNGYIEFSTSVESHLRDDIANIIAMTLNPKLLKALPEIPHLLQGNWYVETSGYENITVVCDNIPKKLPETDLEQFD